MANLPFSDHDDDLRRRFQRHLPLRVEAVTRRIERFRSSGWDINGVLLLHADVQRLAGASGRHGLVEASRRLLALESLLGMAATAGGLPDADLGQRIAEIAEALREAYPTLAESEAESEIDLDADDQAVEPLAVDAERSSDRAGPRSDAPDHGAAAAPSAIAAPSAGQPEPEPARRVYHLSDAGPFGTELDRLFEAEGFEVELLSSVDELCEVLSALPPDAVAIDAGFSGDLERIGAALMPARQRSGEPLPLLAVVDGDDMGLRLLARRARVDVLAQSSAGASAALRRLRAALDPGREPPYRVMIVEDDRSQGLFAESILRNAGMEARVVDDPLQVLPAMAEFAPELVLMDLHMPRANGMELTGLIREREEFVDIPIVFLSGESDQDIQFQVLEAGGDDFIAKPVRPRHLIAAVQNRIRRARAASRRIDRKNVRDPATGLHRRSWLLDRLNELLDRSMAASGPRPGGVVFLEIEGAVRMRERLGLSELERVLTEAGKALALALGNGGIAARFGDATFLVLAPDLDGAALESMAVRLRDALIAQPFGVGGSPLRLRVSAGACAVDHGFAEAGALLNAVERSCRQARVGERGVVRFEPPRHPEEERDSALIESLREAIAAGGFELLYQPIVAVQGSDEAQYQSLLRLRDDGGELHTAATLVPLAESAELIVDVDRWVVEQALRTIAEGRAAGRALRLFVPQSMTSLVGADLEAWLTERLRAHGLEGDCLVLEIRLGDAIIRAASLPALRDMLERLGVRLCLAQFERGEEPDRLLRELRPGYVKLAEKRLLSDSEQASRDELRRLIDVLHLAGALVIGHQIEDAQAAAALWMSGVDFLQGDLVHRAAVELDFDFHASVL